MRIVYESRTIKFPLALEAFISVRYPFLFAALCLMLTAVSGPVLAQHEKEGEESKHPFIGDPKAIEAGQKLFSTGCAACHGVDGGGGRGPSLRERAVWHPMDDKTMYQAIQKGIGGGMPASNLPEDQAWRIVAYVRSLTAPASKVNVPGDAVAGQALFAANCGGCHRVSGKGGFMGPDLSYAGSVKTVAQLRSSILDPSAEIAPGYGRVTAMLTDGSKVDGVARNRTNYSIQILTADGNLRLLSVDRIRELNLHSSSAMPSYKEKLTRDQVQDVIAYLSRLTAGPVAMK